VCPLRELKLLIPGVLFDGFFEYSHVTREGADADFPEGKPVGEWSWNAEEEPTRQAFPFWVILS
jgi:hypothetical protein